MKLDPEIAAVLENPELQRFFTAMRFDTPEGLAELRAMRNARATELANALDRSGVITETRSIPGPAGAMELRIHRPEQGGTNLPCFYFVHGGGMVIGSPIQDDHMHLAYVRAFGCVGLSLRYRLAPEHPAPAAAEDCAAGLAWAAEHASELGIDPDRIVLGGSSGGGGIAACTALMARDRGMKFCFQFLIYPQLDDRHITPSAQGEWIGWTRDVNIAAWKCVLGDRFATDRVTPYDAAARATALAGLPPTYIETSEQEVFRDEDIIYAMRLLAAGVNTELHVWPGTLHGFDLFAPGAKITQQALAARATALRRAWGLAG